MTGIEELREAVQAFGCCREDFLMRFSAQQLLWLRAAWVACEWDIPPDLWTEEQVCAAINLGIVPVFEEAC